MASILVTGSSSGIGRALTEALARDGHRVVMAVRSIEGGQAAAEDIQRRVPAASLRVERLDLMDLDSVRAIAARPFEVDVLVNNAGIAFEPLKLSAQGVVSQFATNHLGHFALTALLFDRLACSDNGRVVTVTSTLAKKGTIDLDALDASRGFNSMRAYTQSKIANVLFAAELHRRLQATGASTKSVLVHPGIPRTAMQQKAKGVIGVVARTMARLAGESPEHGARAVAEAAIGTTVESGEIWRPGNRLGQPPRRERPWPTQADEDAAARLWQRSERLAHISFGL